LNVFSDRMPTWNRKGDVLGRGEIRNQAEMLEHEPNLMAHIFAMFMKVGFTAEYYVIRLSEPSLDPVEPGVAVRIHSRFGGGAVKLRVRR
jgi:hypothetical protein